MKSASFPLNEIMRIKALKSFNILDTLPEKVYDNITRIAAEICNTPIALVSLVDSERQWFKSNYGLVAKETHRDYAFCAYSVLEPDKLFIVSDATKDPRFRNNPLTTNKPNIVFYAGAPLKLKNGLCIGTLCVIDKKPRKYLSEGQKHSLRALAQQVVSQLELRKNNIVLQQTNKEVIRLNDELSQLAYKLSHDLKTPVIGINALVEFIKEDINGVSNNSKVGEWINLIFSRTKHIESLIEALLHYTQVTNEVIHFEDFNIKSVLEEVLKNCNIEKLITLDLNGLDFKILHSKISFIQVFQNLLTNSKKFCGKEKCEVHISFTENKNNFQFVYIDNGPGIPLKYQNKIFNMFETLEDTNCKETGFGLAIVKSIISRLGGGITLKERDDGKEGVCFEFTIPKRLCG